MSASDQAATPDKLVSDLLIEDPDMRDLVEEFVSGLVDRLAEFRQAHEQLNWDNLAKLAHQLKGAGGSYGYSDHSKLGAEMESASQTQSGDQFATWMKQFEDVTAAARKGLQDA